MAAEAGAGVSCEAVVAYDVPERLHLRLTTSREDEGGMQAGDTLTILYLPEASGQAMPYKDCVYKAVRTDRSS